MASTPPTLQAGTPPAHDDRPTGILRTTLLLAGLSMVGPFAIDTFLPSFPAIAHDYAISEAAVQQALTTYLIAFAAMSLFYGTLSDSFGRRRVILIALALFTGASIAAVLAPSFGWLLAARALQGLAAGAGMVIGLAIVRDRFSGAVAHRLMSNITMVFGLAPALAPIIGGFLEVDFGWRSVFAFMAALGVILLAATWWLLDETLPLERRVPFHPATLAASYKSALSNRRFVGRALGCAFAFGAFALYIASAAHVVLNILHLPPTAFAWLFVPMIGGMVGGSSLGGRLARRLPRGRVLQIGWGCMVAASVLNVIGTATLSTSLPQVVLPIMLFTFGLGLAMPVMNLMTLELIPQRGGLAASLLNFMRTLVFAAASGIAAPLLFDSAEKLAWGMAAFCAAAGLCWWTSRAHSPATPLAGATA